MKVFSDYFSEEQIEARMIKKENKRALKKEKKVKKARLRKNEMNRIKEEYSDAPVLIRFFHVNAMRIMETDLFYDKMKSKKFAGEIHK